MSQRKTTNKLVVSYNKEDKNRLVKFLKKEKESPFWIEVLIGMKEIDDAIVLNESKREAGKGSHLKEFKS